MADEQSVEDCLPVAQDMLPGTEGFPVSLSEPVEITNVIRRMRGHSQSFLVRGSDGAHYVCKFRDNPQGNRSLINEWIAGNLLSLLGVLTPDLAVLWLGDSCQGRETLHFTDHHAEITSGLHRGSRCPVDPESTAIFDFLPERLFPLLNNTNEAGMVFAVDLWVSQSENRQFIFANGGDRLKVRGLKPSRRFRAWAIDHGMCFGGMDWTLSMPNTPCRRTPQLYSHCDLRGPAIEGARRIESLTFSQLQAARQDIPHDWFGPGDETALKVLMEALREGQQDFTSSIEEYVATLMFAQKRASQYANERSRHRVEASRSSSLIGKV